MEEFPADPVTEFEYLLGAVVHGIDVHPKRSRALGEVDDTDNLARDFRRVGVGVRYRQLAGRDLLHDAGVQLLVFILNGYVCGVAGARVVTGAGGEGARDDDRGLDPESGQLGSVAYGQRVFAAK